MCSNLTNNKTDSTINATNFVGRKLNIILSSLYSTKFVNFKYTPDIRDYSHDFFFFSDIYLGVIHEHTHTIGV